MNNPSGTAQIEDKITAMIDTLRETQTICQTSGSNCKIRSIEELNDSMKKPKKNLMLKKVIII